MAWLPLRLPPHCKFVVSITCEQGKPDTLENLANLKGQAHEKLDNILSAYLRNCCWYSKAHSRFWALFHRQNASTLIIFSFPVHFTLKIEFFYQVYTITSFWYSSHALLQKQKNVLRCWCTFQCHKFIKKTMAIYKSSVMCRTDEVDRSRDPVPWCRAWWRLRTTSC